MTEDAAVFAEAGSLSAQGKTFAMVSILSSSGSTPRTQARLLVRSDGSIVGTIGGGVLESRVVADARDAITAGRSRILRYELNAQAGSKENIAMYCGGSLELFVDVVAAKRKILIVGAGHVGLALARLADYLGFSVTVADDRVDEGLKARFTMAAAFHASPDLYALLGGLEIDAHTAVVIATHSRDGEALSALVEKPWAYLGILGSRAKVKKMMSELNLNAKTAQHKQIHAPVGIDIGAETPEEIALSIMAEILAVETGTKIHHLFQDLER